MEFKVITTPFPEWDPFCDKYSELLFHTATWLQVLHAGLQYPYMFCTLWEGNDLILGLPVFLMDYKIFKILYATIPYGTIIGDYQALPYFLPALYNFLRSQRFHVLHLGSSYPGIPPLDLSEHTPKYQPLHMLSLQGTSEEEIQKKYKSYTRRGIRRAERFGIKVEKISNRCEIEDFYLLYLCAMERNQAMARYPKRFLYSIYDTIIAKGQGDIFFAKLNNKNVAGIMVLYSKNIAHYYFGGSIMEYQKYQPNEAVFHEAILNAIKMKKSAFDFMGSDAHDMALIHFKQKWGAVPHLTTHYTLVQNTFCYILWNTGLRVLASRCGTALTRFIQRLAPTYQEKTESQA
jgi:GNAT acetyltransferase-like protein